MSVCSSLIFAPLFVGNGLIQLSFGQKLHLSVVNGYTFIEQTCWSNFNEGSDLPQVIENYFRRYGYYPTAVLADKLYQTRNNRNYCKARGIRLSGPALGRKSKAVKEENSAQMYQDACDRNVIEGKNGTAKRRYGLNCIMSKLDETSKTEAGFSILMMNAWKRVYKELLRTFMHLLFYNDGICSIMAIHPVFQ